MGEDGARPGEAFRRQWFRMRRGIFALQCLGKDALRAAHVDEGHVQGPAAGVVQTLRRVPLAQTDQLVSLPDLGPALFQKSYSQVIFGTTGDSVPKVAGLRNTGSIPNS